MIWIGLILALSLSAFFSGLEMAFVSSSKLRVELKIQQGGRRSRLIASFYENPARFLGSMLVGNNIALVIFTLLLSTLLTPVMSPYFEGEVVLLILITLIGTAIVLVFGEFLPKIFFRNFGEQILHIFAIPIKILTIILALPSWFFTSFSNVLLRFFLNTKELDNDNSFSRLELESLVRDTQTFSETRIDTQLFGKALNLKLVRVKDCMVPRTEIEALDVNDSMEELSDLFVSTKLSRLIIIDGDIDNVLGYVHHQQILAGKGPIKKLIFEIPFVPETMKVQDLLNLLIRQKTSIACVVDEYGGTAGLITMEDILEQIFGEIEDEHDDEEFVEEVVVEGEYLFSGRLEVDYLNDRYPELNLPKGDYHTLSGYLVTTTEDIPEEGDFIIIDAYKYSFEHVSDKKIETIRVTRLNPGDEEMAS